MEEGERYGRRKVAGEPEVKGRGGSKGMAEVLLVGYVHSQTYRHVDTQSENSMSASFTPFTRRM